MISLMMMVMTSVRREVRGAEWECRTVIGVRAAGVWQLGRVLRGQEVPLTSCLLEVDFVWFRGGSVVPPLLASVAGSWQGGRRSGRHQPENLHPGCSWGGFSPGVEEPRGVGGVSASWGGLSFVVLIIRGIQPRRGGCF